MLNSDHHFNCSCLGGLSSFVVYGLVALTVDREIFDVRKFSSVGQAGENFTHRKF